MSAAIVFDTEFTAWAGSLDSRWVASVRKAASMRTSSRSGIGGNRTLAVESRVDTPTSSWLTC